MNVTNPQYTPLRVWKAEGKLLDMICDRIAQAFQASTDLETLANGLGKSLIYVPMYQAYYLWDDSIDMESEKLAIPDGYEFHSRSDGLYYLEPKNAEVKKQLDRHNHKIGLWHGIRNGIGHMAGELRGDFDNLGLRDSEFFDRLKSTRDTLRLVQFQVDYYITTAADGLDMPGCTEIRYPDYLRMLADYAGGREPLVREATPR